MILRAFIGRCASVLVMMRPNSTTTLIGQNKTWSQHDAPTIKSAGGMKKFALPVVLICAGALGLAASPLTLVSVPTYHYDNGRTGQNTNETILSPANVGTNTFGKLFSYAVDGYVYAQPLYLPDLTIPGRGTHNVLFIATEHNSVYAFDADNNGPEGGLLWQTNLGPSATTPTSNFGTRYGAYNNIVPEVGITSTPVIDPVSGWMYVDTFNQQGTTYSHSLHALNITDGTEAPFSPVLVTATYPGAGVGSSNGIITFIPKQQIQRAAVTLAGGIVYLAFAGYADTDPYHGWIIGYSASNLVQLTNCIFNTTPNSTNSPNPGEGGIWISGCGLSVDAHTNLYVPIANGSFTATNGSGGTDYGDSVIKLSTTNGLAVADYFTPTNQAILESMDWDLGSGGLLFLPDQPGPFPHLMVSAGKEGRIYLINRDQFTVGDNHYDSTGTVDYVVQHIPGQLGAGCFDTPVFFNGSVFFAASGKQLKAFALTNGMFLTNPISTGPRNFGSPGATPFVSASGTNNGIIWATANANPAILTAYNPSNLTAELYNSAQAATNRDRLANGVKFTSPIVANGKVYVGNQYSVSVFGLLSPSDNWRYAYFGSNATNPALAGDTADPDGDGVVNLLEYALATDPTSSGSDRTISGNIGGNHFQLQFHRNVSATDLTYTAQVANSLDGPWTNLMTYTRATDWEADTEGATASESVPFNVPPDQYVIVTITDPADLTSGTGSRFFRLSVSR